MKQTSARFFSCCIRFSSCKPEVTPLKLCSHVHQMLISISIFTLSMLLFSALRKSNFCLTLDNLHCSLPLMCIALGIGPWLLIQVEWTLQCIQCRTICVHVISNLWEHVCILSTGPHELECHAHHSWVFCSRECFLKRVLLSTNWWDVFTAELEQSSSSSCLTKGQSTKRVFLSSWDDSWGGWSHVVSALEAINGPAL